MAKKGKGKRTNPKINPKINDFSKTLDSKQSVRVAKSIDLEV